MANPATPEPLRTLPQIERVRRGWLFRDARGRCWWLDDTVAVNGSYRVVPPGHQSAQCRVFTPMVVARDTVRRVYRFRAGEDRRLSLGSVVMHHAAARNDPA